MHEQRTQVTLVQDQISIQKDRIKALHNNKHVIFPVIIVITIAIVYLIVYLTPTTFEQWDAGLSDHFFTLRAATQKAPAVFPGIVNLMITDSFAKDHTHAYWNRAIYGDIITGITPYDPTLICPTIIFEHQLPAPLHNAEDAPLLRAVRENNQVLFPFIINRDILKTTGIQSDGTIYRTIDHDTMIRAPYKTLMQSTRGTGFINTGKDNDGVIRKHRLIYPYKDGYVLSYPLLIACEYLQVNDTDIEIKPGKYVKLKNAHFKSGLTKDISIPIDNKGYIPINYKASYKNAFTLLDANTVIDKNREANHLYTLFHDSIVIISDTTIAGKDYAGGIHDSVIPGGILITIILDSILTESFLTKVNHPVSLGILILVLGLLYIGATGLRPLYLAFAGIGGTVLLTGLYYVLFAGFDLVCPVTAPGIIYLLSFSFLLIYRLFIDDKEQTLLQEQRRLLYLLHAYNEMLIDHKAALNEKNTRLLNVNRELTTAHETLREKDHYKTVFFRNISRHFRTPLTMITEPINYLLSNPQFDIPGFVRDMMMRIDVSARKVLFLVNQVLDLSALEAGKMELNRRRVDMIAMLRMIILSYEHLCRINAIHLSFTTPIEHLNISLDPEKIEQAVCGILTDACQRMRAGGILDISIKRAVDTHVDICIMDNGPVIEWDDGTRGFEQPYRLRNISENSSSDLGMGLALALEFIELHEGSIMVDSTPEKGTQFCIRLPMTAHTDDEVCPDTADISVLPAYCNSSYYEHIRESSLILIITNGAKPDHTLQQLLTPLYRVHIHASKQGQLKAVQEQNPDLIIYYTTAEDAPSRIVTALKTDSQTGNTPVIGTAGDSEVHKGFDALISLPVTDQRGVLTKIDRLLKLKIHRDTIKMNSGRITNSYYVYKKGTQPVLPILITDDDRDVLKDYELTLINHGFDNLIMCQDSGRLLPVLEKTNVGLIMLNYYMPGKLSGEQLFHTIKQRYPDIPVIITTGIENIELAVQCLKAGAHDVISKPVDTNRLLIAINQGMSRHKKESPRITVEEKTMPVRITNPASFSHIITRNNLMLNNFMYIEKIADGSHPVLITGESGTGKENIAKVIHELSGRTGDFIIMNAGGIDDALFASDLFGHKKGGFTGAVADRKGLLEKARGGTIFLDEIGDLSHASQVKLLRLTQEGTYYPIGSDVEKKIDVRIITATNKDLLSEIKNKTFRSDLYYRLNRYRIILPSLQERLKDDLAVLVEHFVKEESIELNKKTLKVPRSLYPFLTGYTFPGNIRELKSMVQTAVKLSDGDTLDTRPFIDYINKHTTDIELTGGTDNTVISIKTSTGGFPTIPDVKEHLINEALRISKGNQSEAAKMLGVVPSTINKHLKKMK